MIVACDFETASDCDLKMCGAAVYAEHYGTEVLCFTYSVDGGPLVLWTPDRQEPGLALLAADPAVQFASHAGFEQYIWHYHMVPVYGFPEIPIERWVDTQAACAYHALPLDLDSSLMALDLPVIKDLVGRRLTLGLSRIDKRTGMYPPRLPETMEKVYAYNAVDVLGVMHLHATLDGLDGRERSIWELDQRINHRGITVDRLLVHGARAMADRLVRPLAEEFHDLTGLNPTQAGKIITWLGDQGLDLKNLHKDTVAEVMAGTDERFADLSPEGQRALYIRSLVSASSLSKLDRLKACVNADGRARGLMQYHGSTTGRWAGRLIQPQNFPRPPKGVEKYEIPVLTGLIKEGQASALAAFGEPLEVLVSSLRHALRCSPGSLLGSGDFAGVEARLVLALAGQSDKCALLASGADVYRDMAADIFGIDKVAFMAKGKDALTNEDVEMRQTGKNTILGCGFQMGWKTFWMRYCMHKDHQFAKDAINAYRKVWAPEVPKLWYGIEKAALFAVYNPGKEGEHRGIRFKLVEKGGRQWLVCRLLNGKKIWYYAPDRIMRSMPWDETDVRPGWRFRAKKMGQWKWVYAYGGLLVENIVQAMAREMLVDAMLRFDRAGWPIVLTVHDEVVIDHPDITKEILKRVMTDDDTGWASKIGMPIAVEEWIGEEYRK